MLGDDYATSEVVHHFLRSLTVKVSRTTICRLLDNPLTKVDRPVNQGQHPTIPKDKEIYRWLSVE